MRTTGILAFLIAVLFLCGALALEAGQYAPGQILVKFKPGTPASEMAAAHRQNNAKVLNKIWQIGVQKVTAPKGQEIAFIKRYEKNPNVEFAEPDFLVYPTATIPNDPAFVDWQWGLHRMQAPEAWDICSGSPSIIIALVDTGVNYTHEDLQGRLLDGYNFYANNNDPMDENGHGTHLAGIIGAATNNGIGVAGVTWTNPVLPVKLCGSQGSTTSYILAQGITYSADRGARAINLSWAFSSPSSTMQSAIDYAYNNGVVMIGGTGNNGVQGIAYPAAYWNVLAVGAVDGYDQRAGYSNYGPGLDVVAPGTTMSTTLSGSYGNMGGTSVATAFTTGLCGLILSVNSALSPAQVMQIVRETAEDIAPAGWDQYTGYGRINAYKAVARAASEVPENPEPEPAPEPKPEPDPDITPPSAELVSPVDGSTVSGTISLAANVTDDTGVAKVEYYVDGNLVASSSKSPYNASWSTSAEDNGVKSIHAKAIDAAGNSATSLPATVTVSNLATANYTFTGTLNKKHTVALHSVSLAVPSMVTAFLEFGKNADLNLYLLDSSGKVLASATSTTAQPEKLSTGLLPEGDYTFKVQAVSGTSAYTLNVTCEGQ